MYKILECWKSCSGFVSIAIQILSQTAENAQSSGAPTLSSLFFILYLYSFGFTSFLSFSIFALMPHRMCTSLCTHLWNSPEGMLTTYTQSAISFEHHSSTILFSFQGNFRSDGMHINSPFMPLGASQTKHTTVFQSNRQHLNKCRRLLSAVSGWQYTSASSWAEQSSMRQNPVEITHTNAKHQSHTRYIWLAILCVLTRRCFNAQLGWQSTCVVSRWQRSANADV